MTQPLWTIGHGALSSEAFAGLVTSAGITVVVDVRRRPGSRRHPQFRKAAMERWLPEAGVAYRWVEALGGHREPSTASPNVGVPEPLRAYADHLATGDGRAALTDVLALAAAMPTAVCCAEADWRACHRRVLADAAVVLAGREVRHLTHEGGWEPHEPDPAARAVGDVLRYDRGESPLWT